MTSRPEREERTGVVNIVPELLVARAQSSEGATAAVSGDITVSYADVDARVEALGFGIMRVSVDAVVRAVCAEHPEVREAMGHRGWASAEH